MPDTYTREEQRLLLGLARDTLARITAGEEPPTVDLDAVSPTLVEDRACFVTLRQRESGALRGCTGTLVARRPLVEEVVAMTVQTALHDPRFAPVQAYEVPYLHLEISVLTPSQALQFTDPESLLRKLRPGVDGVTLRLDRRRATFLPQVWQSYPDPCLFLALLAQKMGASSDAWRDPAIQVETYQTILIEEGDDDPRH
jgi:AmmeMemoRadiSam system protein A